MIVGEGARLSTVIMPEGFEVQLTITSLIPETKNLMYDSIDSPVTSDIYTSSEAKRKDYNKSHVPVMGTDVEPYYEDIPDDPNFGWKGPTK